MTGYDKEYINDFNYIKSYEIDKNYIYVKFVCGDVWTIPYNEYNEKQIINNMDNESYEINNYILPKSKKRLVLYAITGTTPLFLSIPLLVSILTGNIAIESISSFILLNTFSVISLIFGKENYDIIKKCNERNGFLTGKLKLLENKQSKHLLRLVPKHSNEFNNSKHKYSISELKTMALNIKERLLNDKNNSIKYDNPPKLTVYTNEQIVNVKTLKHKKKKK